MFPINTALSSILISQVASLVGRALAKSLGGRIGKGEKLFSEGQLLSAASC